MLTMSIIGRRCRRFRQISRFSQREVAKETQYSQVNVSRFEAGENDNSEILMWYFEHGMPIQYLLTGNEVYLNGDD